MYSKKSLFYVTMFLAIFVGISKSEGIVANAFLDPEHLYEANIKSDQNSLVKPFLIRFEDHRMMLLYGNTQQLITGTENTLTSQLDSQVLDSRLQNLFGKEMVQITNNSFSTNSTMANSTMANSTMANSTMTNSMMSNSTMKNPTMKNKTTTNSTMVDSTIANSFRM